MYQHGLTMMLMLVLVFTRAARPGNGASRLRKANQRSRIKHETLRGTQHPFPHTNAQILTTHLSVTGRMAQAIIHRYIRMRNASSRLHPDSLRHIKRPRDMDTKPFSKPPSHEANSRQNAQDTSRKQPSRLRNSCATYTAHTHAVNTGRQLA